MDAADAEFQKRKLKKDNELRALKALFAKSDMETLALALNLSTLKPYELTKSDDKHYEFTRRLHLSPRANLSSDMLDAGEQLYMQKSYELFKKSRQQLSLEYIAETTFTGPTHDAEIYDIDLSLDDEFESYKYITLLAATIIFSPLAAFECYRRFRASQKGVTLVLRGRMRISHVQNKSIFLQVFPKV